MPDDPAEDGGALSKFPFPMAAALLGMVVAVPGILLIALHGFDGLYGQDAFGYVGYALGPLTAAIADLQPLPHFFWPPGYPLLVALMASVGLGEMAGQVVALLAGSLLPVAAALLARQVLTTRYGDQARDRVALFAGVVAAVAGQLWQSSVVAMSDTSGALFATLGAWACCRFYASGGWLPLAASAAALALAIEVRWIYGLVALPFVVLALAGLARDSRVNLRKAIVAFAAASVVAAVVVAPTMLAMVEALSNGRPLPFVGNFDVYGWNPGEALRSTFETVDGRLSYTLPTAVFYLSQPVQHYWLFGLGVLVVPGFIAALRNSDAPSTAVLVAWPALVIVFHIGGAYQNTRFFLATLPPVAILAALGAWWLWRLAARRPDRIMGIPRDRLVALALGAAVVANALLAMRFTNAFVDRQSADLAAIRGLAEQVPAAARIISLGATSVLRHDGREVVELFGLDPVSAQSLLANGQQSYLLVDANAVRGQFAELAAGRTVAAFETSPGLSPVASEGIWTLYLIGR